MELASKTRAGASVENCLNACSMSVEVGFSRLKVTRSLIAWSVISRLQNCRKCFTALVMYDSVPLLIPYFAFFPLVLRYAR